MLYVIKTPEGVLLEKTASTYQSASWDYLQLRCHKNIPLALRKKMNAIQWRAAKSSFLRKHGFTCVRVKMIELQDEVEFS